jgi:ABC-type transport system involved in multi-copper enzyme maturation permease subunit
MLHIVKTEWLKIKKYPAFWWVMGITALTYPAINSILIYQYYDLTEKQNAAGQVVKALLGNPFAFPEAWKTVAYFSSIFVFIPAIVIIMLITNEYTYKTNRQNVIDGWSRKDFMTGKLIDVIILSVIVTILYSFVALIIGITNTTHITTSGKWNLVYYIGLFAMQTFSQLSLAFMVGLLVRKSFIALAIFAFYFIMLEPISVNLIRIKLHSNIGRFFPLQVSHRLIPRPAFIGRFDEKAYQETLDAVKYHVGYTLVLIILTWAFCFWINNRRDL